jgi:hypothetical protein
MKLVRIREAKPLGNQRVELTLTDGRVVERDLGPMLVGPVFSEIRNDEVRFMELRVEGGALVWPNGADLCPDVLIWDGLPPTDAAAGAA